MTKPTINRRTMLKGLATVSIGLPLLEEMVVSTANAAEQKAAPTRAFNVFFGLGIPAPLQTEGFDGLLGAGFNWGQPNEDTFAPGLDDQYALEFFYRVPVGKRVAVTVDTQLIQNPALNPDRYI